MDGGGLLSSRADDFIHESRLKLHLLTVRVPFPGDHTFNGEETDGNRTFSEGEGDTSKATDTELASPRKEKKKKSGLRTPSFLKKKKKDKKKEKEKA